MCTLGDVECEREEAEPEETDRLRLLLCLSGVGDLDDTDPPAIYTEHKYISTKALFYFME